jgi:methionyl-tRNA formyltransferase
MLPRYRGAAPIQWALINGDKETGVCVQSLSERKVDRGEIWAMKGGVVSFERNG